MLSANAGIGGGRYEYSFVIEPDEYHNRVDNNFFTKRKAQWNLQTALEVVAWLKGNAPHKASELVESLDACVLHPIV
jgi:kojibiose phosphorylase